MLKPTTIARLRSLASGPGVIASVDGQYGSTGKGVINGIMGTHLSNLTDIVVTNAGPNSGHTSYFNGKKIVLKQLPTFGVTAHLQEREWEKSGLLSQPPHIRLSAGAVINPDLFAHEINEYELTTDISVHQNAAIVNEDDLTEDDANVTNIASTGQGVGPAIIRKMERASRSTWSQNVSLENGWSGMFSNIWPGRRSYIPMDIRKAKIYLEVSQGFSLGINSGFYPHVTSRECTVSQAMADAQLPPNFHKHTIMSVRTYPIRVGNTENSSGPCYPDQQEISWDTINQKPEYTTVTNRVRRVFTWSKKQYIDALLANDPDVIFVNFCNYLAPGVLNMFLIDNIIAPYTKVLNRAPIMILLGFGPKPEDVEEWGL